MFSHSENEVQSTASEPMPSRSMTFWRVFSLAAFPAGYLAIIAALALTAIGLIAWLIASPPGLVAGAAMVTASILSGYGALQLARALFDAGDVDDQNFVELAPADQPELFAFVHDLCERCHTAPPDRIYAFPAVNAGVYIRTIGAGLFAKTERNLLIGLGLVNGVNRSELEAVLAHEFGHFSQRPLLLQHYVEALDRVFSVTIETLESRWLPSRLVASVLQRLLGVLQRLDSSVSHDMELWADAAAVEVAGTEALVSALAITEHSDRCFSQTLYDLEQALAHDLHTEDLFFHHSRLMESTGDREELSTDAVSTPSDSHPSPAARQAMAHRSYHRSSIDDRSAWTLFVDAHKLRKTLTDQLYRTRWGIDDSQASKSTHQVQRHLDGEHAEVLLGPADSLVYGHRFLDPGDLEQAIATAGKWDCDDNSLRDSLSELMGPQYSEAIRRVSRNIEARRLPPDLPSTRALRDCVPTPTGPIEPDGQDDRQWLAHWDQRMLIASLCAAKRAGDQSYQELIGRYRFHLSLQDLIRWMRAHTPHLAQVLSAVDSDELDEQTGSQALKIATDLHEQLTRGLVNMPPLPELHGLPPGQALSMVVFDEALIDAPEQAKGTISRAWLDRFAAQWKLGSQRLDHLRRKSLGALLLYQRQIQAPWIDNTDDIS